MSQLIPIAGFIISAPQLPLDAGKVAAEAVHDAPPTLKERNRWVQCTVKNESQFQVLLTGMYFDSGRYWDAPGSIPPFSQMVFSACEKDCSIFTGAEGGTAFKLILDDRHSFDFALGWANPAVGSFKAGVVQSSNAEQGYIDANENGSALMSTEVFTGKDKDGEPAQFRIHISAAPGQNALFVITQVLSPLVVPSYSES